MIFLSMWVFSVGAFSEEDIFRIEIGKNPQNYSNSEVQERLWKLERAVWQLQQKVFQLETTGTQPNPVAPKPEASWICTIDAMGTSYTGTGTTRAVALNKVVEKCKKGRNGDGFFCKDPKCEQ